LEMLLAFAELVYTGTMQRTTISTGFNIAGYRGSAIFNCQPGVLAGVMSSPEWEATIADKTVRYYHLYRPVEPNEASIDVKIDWDADMLSVAVPNLNAEPFVKLVRLGEVQWGRARAREHIRAFLRSAAALDHRTVVDETDFRVVKELMRPMVIEQVVMRKTDWDSPRYFDVGLLYLLIEFASYGTVKLQEIMTDYKLDEYHALGAMSKLNRYYEIRTDAPQVYVQSKITQDILTQVRPNLGMEIYVNGRTPRAASDRRPEKDRKRQVHSAAGPKKRGKRA